MLARVFSAYERALLRRPLVTKCAMSVAVLGTADAGAQGLQHFQERRHTEQRPAFELDLQRQRAVAVYSVGFQGPFGHWWYNLMEHRVAPLLPARYVVVGKVVCDQAVNALASNILYFSFIPWFEGKPVDEIKQKLRMDLGPTYFIDCFFWPITSFYNFKYVPVRHQLLCCNVVLLGWTLFMSYVCHDDSLLRRFDAYNPCLTEADRKMLEQRAGGAAAAVLKSTTPC